MTSVAGACMAPRPGVLAPDVASPSGRALAVTIRAALPAGKIPPLRLILASTALDLASQPPAV
jgi:hypothetical protein